MPLTAVTFEVTPGQADLLGDALLEAGALAVDVGDALAGTPEEQAVFDEPGEWNEPLRPIRWQRARLAALFEDAAQAEALVGPALAECAIDPSAMSGTRTVEDADWVALTQREFEPIRITDRLWIVPTWHQPPDPAACGSGVLAIGAARLGAAKVSGIDIDPEAVTTAAANAIANGIDGATFCLPDDAGDAAGYDVVVANILARPLMALAPLLAAQVRPGGMIALAGLLDSQAAQIAEVYAPGCELMTVRTLDGWALLAGMRVR